MTERLVPPTPRGTRVLRAGIGSLFTISLLVGAVACSRPPSAPLVAAPAQPPDLLESSRRERDRDNLAGALQLVEEGLTRFPTHTGLALERVNLLVLLDRQDDALAAVDRLPQDDPAVLGFRGYIELLADDLAGARTHLERAVALTEAAPGKTGARPRFHLGLLELRAGSLPRARAAFKAAADRDPTLIDAAYQLLGVAERMNDAANAAAAREAFGRLYHQRLTEEHAFDDVRYDESRPLNRGDDVEWRPLVAETRFVRTFPAGAGVEFACHVPPGVTLFRIRAVDGVGAGTTVFAGLHGVSERANAPWVPHVIELPRGNPGQTTTLEFEVLAPAWWQRVLRRAPPRGAAFSEPFVLAPAAPAAKPNIVLISLDTLRADKVGVYGGRESVSPAIDRLAAEGVRFARAESASNWTLPSHYSLMTGFTPAAHGVLPSPDRTRGYTNPGDHVAVRGSGKEEMLAEVLAKAGYRTAAVTEGAWVSPRFGFDQGFRYYRYALAGGLPATRIASVADLREFGRRGPWFLFVHSYTTHQPYYAPKPYRLKYADPNHVGLAWPSARVPISEYRHLHHPAYPAAPSDQRAFRDLYDGQVAYADTLVAAIVDELKKQGLYDNTVIVVTSDHGEELFDRSVLDHGDSLFEEQTHVPLIVRAPGINAPRVVDARVSTLDLAATVLDLAGLGTTHGDGTSLRPAWERAAPSRPGFAESIGRGSDDLAACWDGTLKYVRRTVKGARREWLFDLAKDPAESKDLAAARPADLERLRALYDTHATAARVTRNGLGTAVVPLDPQEIERLKSLGYVR